MKEPPKLSRSLFWDTNPDTVNFDKSARYVIEKVVTRGQFEDWQEIKRYYGLETIKQQVVRSRDLDPRTLNFLSNLLDIPKEKFRYHKLMQLYPDTYPWY